ncbi:MAG: CoA transferase, partial [Magnetovibrio sp.]|nr:CoA transferase [Magnetovibrio sp.]
MSYAEPYKGLKILDLSQGFAGPYCIALFSLYGAEVTKVEPIEGDWIRGIGKAFAGQTPLSLVANPFKRSIALNLKEEKGREIVHKL